MGRKIEVRPGDKYNRLTVIKEVGHYISPSGYKQRKFLVQCECGSEPFEVPLNSLRTGNTNSCGCLAKERAKEASKKYNTYDLSGECGIGLTSKGQKFLFDLEDFDLIKNYCWYVDLKKGYIVAHESNTNKKVSMHRLVMNCPEGKVVDHIDHKKNNNCKSNLRICTQTENSRNLSIAKNNNSGVTGVGWNNGNNRWRARITVNREEIHLGSFITKEEAIQARLEAEKKYFGEFSNNKTANTE